MLILYLASRLFNLTNVLMYYFITISTTATTITTIIVNTTNTATSNTTTGTRIGSGVGVRSISSTTTTTAAAATTNTAATTTTASSSSRRRRRSSSNIVLTRWRGKFERDLLLRRKFWVCYFIRDEKRRHCVALKIWSYRMKGSGKYCMWM